MSGISLAQTTAEIPQDSVAPASKKWNIFPVAYYTPETQFGFGTKLIHVRKSEGFLPTDRPTVYSPTLVYTTRKQILTAFTADVWRKHNKEHFQGQVEYNDYPYFFFGLGNEAPDHQEEAYTSRTVNFAAQYERAFYGKVYLGARYEFKYETIPEVEPGGQLAEKTILGSEGTRSSGFGPSLMVDSRDNVFTPTRGYFNQVSAMFFGKYLGGETNFNRYKVDLRKYQKIGPGVFAVQGLFTFVTGDAPFQFLSPLGGVNVMRGLLEGRFRDEDAAVIQADYRFPLFWRIGGAVFGGAGQVSRRIPDFAFNRFHLTGGGGLRYKLNNEGMVVRGDVAFSDQGMYLYFAFSEAF
ncbi:BamA/TamA family outer membrane protein [Sabulibacter ruber]|uniref:BamA/TamA family outer membrane protein n=1 Tax=Sabulibacter ruber TaxID=2811901 RepID=UPI001A97A8D6|nr:BamA/TamA family outer membrane protein [Sabulibacter ruber]